MPPVRRDLAWQLTSPFLGNDLAVGSYAKD